MSKKIAEKSLKTRASKEREILSLWFFFYSSLVRLAVCCRCIMMCKRADAGLTRWRERSLLSDDTHIHFPGSVAYWLMTPEVSWSISYAQQLGVHRNQSHIVVISLCLTFFPPVLRESDGWGSSGTDLWWVSLNPQGFWGPSLSCISEQQGRHGW